MELAEPSQASEDFDLGRMISLKINGVHTAATIAHLARQMVEKLRWLANGGGELVAMIFELDEAFHAGRSRWDPKTQGKERYSGSGRGADKLGALVLNLLSSCATSNFSPRLSVVCSAVDAKLLLSYQSGWKTRQAKVVLPEGESPRLRCDEGAFIDKSPHLVLFIDKSSMFAANSQIR